MQMLSDAPRAQALVQAHFDNEATRTAAEAATVAAEASARAAAAAAAAQAAAEEAAASSEDAASTVDDDQLYATAAKIFDSGADRSISSGGDVSPVVGRKTWPAPKRFLCVLSLAEGETLRRVLHLQQQQSASGTAALGATSTAAATNTSAPASNTAAAWVGPGLCLRTLDGGPSYALDASPHFRSFAPNSTGETDQSACFQCLRFANCEM